MSKFFKVLEKLPYRIYMILTRPERFFKKIVVDGSLEESMVKAFLFGLFGGAALLVIGLIGAGTVGFWDVVIKLALYPPIAVGVLFVFAGLMMLFSEVAGGTRDWEIAVKGVSSLFFMYPAILVLDALAFSCWSLWIINMVVDGYLLFLIYNVARHCMNAKKKRVLVVIAGAAAALIMLYGSNYRFMWLSLKNPTAAMACIA